MTNRLDQVRDNLSSREESEIPRATARKENDRLTFVEAVFAHQGSSLLRTRRKGVSRSGQDGRRGERGIYGISTSQDTQEKSSFFGRIEHWDDTSDRTDLERRESSDSSED